MFTHVLLHLQMAKTNPYAPLEDAWGAKSTRDTPSLPVPRKQAPKREEQGKEHLEVESVRKLEKN